MLKTFHTYLSELVGFRQDKESSLGEVLTKTNSGLYINDVRSNLLATQNIKAHVSGLLTQEGKTFDDWLSEVVSQGIKEFTGSLLSNDNANTGLRKLLEDTLFSYKSEKNIVDSSDTGFSGFQISGNDKLGFELLLGKVLFIPLMAEVYQFHLFTEYNDSALITCEVEVTAEGVGHITSKELRDAQGNQVVIPSSEKYWLGVWQNGGLKAFELTGSSGANGWFSRDTHNLSIVNASPSTEQKLDKDSIQKSTQVLFDIQTSVLNDGLAQTLQYFLAKKVLLEMEGAERFNSNTERTSTSQSILFALYGDKEIDVPGIKNQADKAMNNLVKRYDELSESFDKPGVGDFFNLNFF